MFKLYADTKPSIAQLMRLKTMEGKGVEISADTPLPGVDMSEIGTKELQTKPDRRDVAVQTHSIGEIIGTTRTFVT